MTCRTSVNASQPGRGVTGLTMLADRVRLDLDGQPSVMADVTPAAVAELSLHPGNQIWLTVKATDLEVYPPSGQLTPDARTLPHRHDKT
jgi:molybdate transport system ATP-binding protein